MQRLAGLFCIWKTARENNRKARDQDQDLICFPDMEIVTDTWLELKTPGKLKKTSIVSSAGMEGSDDKAAKVRFTNGDISIRRGTYLW